MNNVTLSGKISREIKVKLSAGGKLVGSFTLTAENGSHSDEIPIIAWERPAREIFQRTTVGDVIEVRGSIRRSENDDVFVKLDNWQPIALHTPQNLPAATSPQLSVSEQAEAYAALCERLRVHDSVRIFADVTAISAVEIDKTIKSAVWAIVQLTAAEAEICAPAVAALTAQELRRIAGNFFIKDDRGNWKLKHITNMKCYVFKVLQNNIGK